MPSLGLTAGETFSMLVSQSQQYNSFHSAKEPEN